MRPEPRSRLPDAEDRDRIVMELDQSMLVEAAAGTGKTSSLVNRMVALLAGRHDRRKRVALRSGRLLATGIRCRWARNSSRGVRHFSDFVFVGNRSHLTHPQ